MKSEPIHLTECELILAADGELPPGRRAQVAAHLETCWQCRERMHSLEGTIADLVRARNRDLNRHLPPAAGPAALLRARLAEEALSASPRRFPANLFPPLSAARLAMAGRLAMGAAAFAILILGILMISGPTVNAEGPKPQAGLTPGETRPITLDEVCRYRKAEVISLNIPEDVRQQVFGRYGIKSPRAGQFEIDYLITPDLGGTESVRNLWPQPYSTRWNARVKDELEERLHELVCSRQLDLATAQHDIAVDWIGAYKKYVGPR